MDTNLLIGIIGFVIGVLQLLASQTFTPPSWLPILVIIIGILNVLKSALGQAFIAKLRGK